MVLKEAKDKNTGAVCVWEWGGGGPEGHFKDNSQSQLSGTNWGEEGLQGNFKE